MSNGEWYYLLGLLVIFFGTVFYDNIRPIIKQRFEIKNLSNLILSAAGLFGVIIKLIIIRIGI